jgi:hypothetical protein
MKKLFLPLLALVILSILGYVAYSGRYQIATKVWHWRHGNAVHVGGYQVPVPDNWLVLNITSRAVQLLNTQAKEHSDPAFPVNASITVSSLQAPVPNLDSWKAIKQQWFGHDGQHAVVERELRFENERVLCVGGRQLRDVLHVPNASILALECSSTGTLSLLFVGEQSDLRDFDSIVTQIRKEK